MKFLALCLALLSSCAKGVQENADPALQSLRPTHVVFIVTPICVTVVALVAAAVATVLKRLRLSVLLVLVVWTGLLCVGMSSWAVTFVASYEEFVSLAEKRVTDSAELSIANVLLELGSGVEMANIVLHLTSVGELDLSLPWPQPHKFLDGLVRTVGKMTRSIDAVILGTPEGGMRGIQPNFVSNGTFSAHRHISLNVHGQYLPAWARCPEEDYSNDCATIATPSACAENASQAVVLCPKSCGLGPAGPQNCVGKHIAFATVLKSEAPEGALTDSVFAEPAEELRSYSRVFPMDTRERPWYTTKPGLQWSRPAWSPGVQAPGIFLSAAALSPEGDFVGSVFVNFMFARVNSALQLFKPSVNGIVLLVTMEGALMGSSLTDAELEEDSGQDFSITAIAAQVQRMNTSLYRSESRVLRLLGAVRERFGDLGSAEEAVMTYHHAGDVIVSQLVRLQGLDLLVVVSSPLEDAMGRAGDASEMSLVLTLTISIVLAICVALGVGVALRPLKALQRDMFAVARMELDAKMGSLSNLTEVRSMQTSFERMVENLIEYKQYLPHSVLHDQTDTDRPVVNSDGSESLSSKSGGSSLGVSMEAKRGYMFTSELKTCNVTVCVANLAGFMNISESTMVSSHSSYIEYMLNVIKANRGIVDEFIGDKVHSSFNTVIPTTLHAVNAARAQWTIKGSMRNVNTASVSSKAVCGNMGCKMMKKYTITGPCAAQVWTFERWGKHWGIDALVNKSVFASSYVEFDLRMLVRVRTSRTQDTYLYQVMGVKKAGAPEEWMYELGRHEASGHTAHNTALMALYCGNYKEAMDALKDFPNKWEELRIRIGKCEARKTEPQPLPLVYIPGMEQEVESCEYSCLPEDPP